MSKLEIIERSDANGKKNDDSTIFIRQGERAILCIADGISRMARSDIASGYCTQLVKKWSETRDANKMGRKTVLRELSDLFYRIHIDLIAYSQENNTDLGTTLIVAVVGLGKMVLCSIGDSRVYVCQGGICSLVTKDQTAAQEERDGLRFFPDIPDDEKESILSQWLGTGKDIPDPKFYEIDLDEEVAILLCTDGLYENNDEEEIYRAVFGNKDLSRSLDMMISKAKKQGETDNISAVLYRRGPGKETAETIRLDRKKATG